MSNTEVLDDLLAVRESRRVAALVKYRKMVDAIAAGEAMPAKFGTGLDNIMVRLELVDDNISQDVAAARAHQQASAKVAEVESDRPEIEARVAEAGATVDALREEQKSFDMRLRIAEQAVREARMPLGAVHTARGLLAKLEREHPRLYGPLEACDA